MKRKFLIVAVLLAPGCESNPGTPSELYPTYFLSRVNDQSLPVVYAEDGTLLLAGGLGFGALLRPRAEPPTAGTVNYFLLVRWPDQSEHQSTVELNYTIEGDVLHINLCPPLALCITTTELIGPILGPNEELVLTHYVGGDPGAVYRYFPSLPD